MAQLPLKLLHHKVRDFSTQREIFEKVTVAAEALEDPARAPGQIDSALRQCVRYKRPVYLELPRDVVDRTRSKYVEAYERITGKAWTF